MPWILTSDPFARPWPAAVNLACRWYLGESLPAPRYTPKTVRLANSVRAISPVMIRTARSDTSYFLPQLPSDSDRVTAAPEHERENQIENDDSDDAEPD